MTPTPTASIPCGPGIARRGGALPFLAGALISVATWVSAQTGSFDLVATIATPAASDIDEVVRQLEEII